MSRIPQTALGALVALGCGLSWGCGCANERSASGGSEDAPRVANNDPRGVDNQPDYEGLAAALKEKARRRFPDTMPSDYASACAGMLKAVERYYGSSEPDALQRSRRLEELASTREADQADCESSTSIEAAVCTQVLLDEGDGEFAWLLDQCSRAFPRAATPEPSPEPAAAAAAPTMHMAFVGDVIFGRYRDDGFDPIVENDANPFTEVAPLLESDLLVANLETPVVEVIPERSPIYSKYRFAAGRREVKWLAEAGFDVVSLANNHFYDLKEEGQRRAPEILREESIVAVGSSVEEGPAIRLESVEHEGWKIGFVALTTRRNAPAREGAPVLPFASLREIPPAVVPLLEGARADHDVLIVFVHWGDEYVDAVDNAHRRAAHALVDAGADLVVGHHPHVLQGVERYGRGLIAYSMGNFLFEHTGAIPRLTGVLHVNFEREGESVCRREVSFAPAVMTRLPGPHPVPATGGLRKRVVRRLLDLSARLDTEWSDPGTTPESPTQSLKLAGEALICPPSKDATATPSSDGVKGLAK